ncbi:MAG: hypothetical protein ACI4NM_03240 [Bullifex sp.]
MVICTSCALTPEEEDRRELTPALKHLDAPTGLTVMNDHSGRRIQLNWNEVSGATHYIVEYQSATDYLSGREMKTYVTQGTSFILTTFPNSGDMRYVFRVKAAYRDTIRSLESEYTPEAEGAVVDDITVTPVIKDSYLCFYVSHARVNSILKDGTIAECSVSFYEGDFTASDIPSDAPVLESGKRFMNSKETVVITAVLTADGKQVKKKAVTVSSDISYTPRPLVSLKGTAGDADGITLTWECPPVNDGLTDTQVLFRIERRDVSSSEWKEIRSGEEDGLHRTDADTSGFFTVSYTDTTAENGHDYIYRVTTLYLNNENGSAFWTSEDSSGIKQTDVCHIMDKTPESLILSQENQPKRNGDGNWEIYLKFSVDTFHNLPDGASIIVKRTPADESDSSLIKVMEPVYPGIVEDTIILTPEQKRDPKSFSYSAAIRYADGSVGEYITARYKNGEPVAIQVDGEDMVIVYENGSLTATNDLAESTELRWNVRRGGYPADFDTSKVTFSVYRSDGEVFTGIPFNADSCSFTDAIESDVSYEYRVRAVYGQSDESASDYRYVRNYPYSEIVRGSSLPSVTGLEVSRNIYTDKITASWNACEGASSYRVTYTPEGGSENVTETQESSIEITDIPSEYYGSPITVNVKAVDKNGNVQRTGSAAEGMILGPAGITVTGGARDITVTWDSVEGASRYKVSVYNSESDDSPIASEVVNASAEHKYVLSSDSDIIRNNTSVSYPLSKSYWFSVSPMVGTSTPASVTKVKGSWIQPPKDIRASKAAYRDMITLKWDSAVSPEPVMGYNIYCRTPGETQWTLLQYWQGSADHEGMMSTDIINLDTIREFSISAVTQSRAESPVQDYFDGDANIGYVILTPGNVICNSEILDGKEYFSYSFDKVPGATGYRIEASGRSVDITSAMIESPDSEKKDLGVFADDDRVTVYLERPAVLESVVITSGIRSVSANAVLEDKNTSVPAITETKVSTLYDHEVVSIACWMLSEPYNEANNSFGGDWWTPSVKTYRNPDYSATITNSCKTEQNQGSAIISNYQRGIYSISSGTLSNNAKDNFSEDVGLGYLGVDPLEHITGTIILQLPFGYPAKTITFESYGVYGDQGKVYVDDSEVTNLSLIGMTILGGAL